MSCTLFCTAHFFIHINGISQKRCIIIIHIILPLHEFIFLKQKKLWLIITPPQIIIEKPRVEVVDALRGLAILLILIIHSMNHFCFSVYPEYSSGWFKFLDKSIYNIFLSFTEGRAYSIFATLFGFTFYIQSNNQKKKNKDFGYRFLWRMVLLIGFSTINAAFFPGGDVLLLFVIISPFLFFTRNSNNSTILAVALICLMQPLEILRLANEFFHLFPNIFDFELKNMYSKEYIKNGDFMNFVIRNITYGQKASLCYALTTGRFFQTAGLFLLGFYIGKKQYFLYSEHNFKVWITVLIVCSIMFAPLSSMSEYTRKNYQIVSTFFVMWSNLSFTFTVISSFLILYQRKWFMNLVSPLCKYGKMSLTNYITQSIFAAFIFFPFGLNLASYFGYALSLVIAILIFLVQLALSKLWIKKHNKGPFEYIWHKLTWIVK